MRCGWYVFDKINLALLGRRRERFHVTNESESFANAKNAYGVCIRLFIQQFPPLGRQVHSMATAANNATTLDQVNPWPHNFAGLWVKPRRHRTHSAIDWAIGAASQ